MDGKIERILHDAEWSEKAIEAYLRDRLAQRGLACLKFSSGTQCGYPDRLVLLPGGRVAWVELKSRGKRPTRLQALRHEQLRAQGHTVEVVDSKARVDQLVEAWTR